MARGARICGAYMTIQIPVIMGVIAFLSLIGASVMTGIGANPSCYNWYDDYSQDYCHYYYESLLISGIVCLVISFGFLIAAIAIFLKIKNTPDVQPTFAPPQVYPVVMPTSTSYMSSTSTSTSTYPAQYQTQPQYATQYPAQYPAQNQQQAPPAYYPS